MREGQQHAGLRLAKSIQTQAHRVTRRAHNSEIAEDYVEVIADLIREHGEARIVDIAKRFGVTHVTVTRTISRMQKAGLVTAQPYRAIFLTPRGEALARECRERHEVVFKFLKAIGVSEKNAAMDAEGIEHHVSGETLEALVKVTKRLCK